MGLIDEQIIKEMNSYKAGMTGDIETGVYIKEELIEFEKIELFNNKMSIMLPKNFKDMPEQYRKIKYPSEQRPPIIFTNGTYSMDFSFNHVESPLKNENVLEIMKSVKNMIKNMFPANVFYEMNEIMTQTQTNVGWFDYKSHGIDNKVYNLLFYMAIDGKLTQGAFNCIYSEAKYWKPIVIQMIETIRDLTLREGKDR